ncbi:Alkaline nuclease [Frankliniella fusca]|uniref:Alkaline nuclease n=1 Tax=Frankliniella fusca TaxID=407009 RepID=A0AAE1HB94_9NEOP|nr:Alkaline nuclease [Frankliniella fusca]
MTGKATVMTSRKSVIKYFKINEYFRKFESVSNEPPTNNNNPEIDLENDPETNDEERTKRRKNDLHKQCRRGEKAFEAGHVKNFVFDPSLSVIKGNAFLNEDFSIKDANCDCVRGTACHHIAALLICAHYNISVTDIECTWKAKPSADRNDGVSFNELFPHKPFSAMNEPSESEVKRICDNIETCKRGCAGIAWIMQSEPDVRCENENEDEPSCPLIPNILQIVSCSEFLAVTDKFDYLLTKTHLQPSNIVAIAHATVGQISNPLWCEGRQCRFSGSVLGSIIHAVSKNRKLAPSLIRTVSTQAMLRPEVLKTVGKKGKYSEKINPRQWGQDHEAEAKLKFTEKTNLGVQETGLWIHESGIWCASPDALVGDNAVLEIKCPFQFRAAKSLKVCLDQDIFLKTAPSKRYAIYYDKDLDEYFMWKEHEYYHQVQSEMWCSFRELCYFVVWIPEDVAVVEVERDDVWYEENVPKLITAYKEQFLPVLIKINK